MLGKRSIGLWIFDFVSLCLASLLIITISSLLLSNPPLSTIHGQVPDNDTASEIIVPDDGDTARPQIIVPDDGDTARPQIIVPDDGDREPPVITVPDDIIQEATGPDGAQIPFQVTAEDNVDGPGDVELSCDRNSGDTFPIGETVVRCRAEDEAGNEGTASFRVIVTDRTAPVITGTSNLLVEASSPDGTQVTYAVSAEDNVDGAATLGKSVRHVQDDIRGDITISCNPASGSQFLIGDTTVQCSAEDEAGNEGTASFMVTVYFPDRISPVITVPDDIIQEATGPDGAQVTYAVSAEDNVDGAAILEKDGSTVTQGDGGGDITISCNPASGFIFQVSRITAVQCSAEDEAGNEGTASFMVTVTSPTVVPDDGDREPPVITVPDDIIQEATGPDGAQIPFQVTAEDNVDGPVGVTCDRNSGGIFPISETVVTCIAEDLAGNTGEELFMVTVKEQSPPTNAILWAVLASIIVIGAVALGKHASNQNRRRIKIPHSAIVDITTKGGTRK